MRPLEGSGVARLKPKLPPLTKSLDIWHNKFLASILLTVDGIMTSSMLFTRVS